MQDYDAKMEGTQIQIKGLFIDSPGENTIDLNKDHFVKRERINVYVNLVRRLHFYPSNQCPSGS